MDNLAWRRRANTSPDLILLDLGLPAGEGFVVMDRFKAVPAPAAIPIIVVSGRSGQQTGSARAQRRGQSFS